MKIGEKMVVEVLFESIIDKRSKKNKRKIIIFCPIGDSEQLLNFVKHIKNIGLNKRRDIDFLFIYRKGMDYTDLSGFSAIHAIEKYPIGTSGAFFAGQAYCYELGYDFIITCDADSVIDSAKTFDSMLELAEREKKVVSAPIFETTEQKTQKCTNPNGWGFFPREIFEKIGFSIPYTWRGGDDFEMAYRLDRAGMRIWYPHGKIFHSLSGFTIYHRIVERNKYYPYVTGISRAMLFISEYDLKYLVKYCIWYVFNRFFAVLLDEPELGESVDISSVMQIRIKQNSKQNQKIKIEKSETVRKYSTFGHQRYVFVPLSIISILINGSCEVNNQRIILLMSRWKYVIRLVAATVLIPIFFFLSLSKIVIWQKERKKVVYPIMASDLPKVVGLVSKMCTNGGL